GRGTTPVQAALMGRRPIGNDLNPLAVLLTRPRLAPPSREAVMRRLDAVPWDRGTIEREDLLAFYHPGTLRRLEALPAWLLERAPRPRGRADRPAPGASRLDRHGARRARRTGAPAAAGRPRRLRGRRSPGRPGAARTARLGGRRGPALRPARRDGERPGVHQD